MRRRTLRAGLMLGCAWFAAPAFADCNLVGTPAVDGQQQPIYHCDTDYVSGKMVTDTVLTLTDLSTGSSAEGPGVHLTTDDTEESPVDLTLILDGDTLVVAPTYDGVDMRSNYGDLALTVGADARIAPDQTGVHLESYSGGDVTITNYGTINAGANTNPMGAEGIAGLASGGSVYIYNYGTVTTSYDPGTSSAPATGRGILADGGSTATSEVEVYIYNDGDVTAIHDGLRVNSYNGLGKVVNDVDGVVTSTDRRGVVVWSKANAAEFENYGSVTALDGPGANVWAEGTVTGYARLINGGSITSYDSAERTGSDSVFSGVHIWSEVTGNAELTNLAGGSIVAHDGWGAWLQSTDGDVVISNAGLIKGDTVAVYVGADQLAELTGVEIEDYEGAIGDALSLSNSGLLTAFGTNSDSRFGVVTLAGDVTTLSFSNGSTGIVGAGIDLESGFDTGLLTAAAADRQDLLGAAANAAIVVAAAADTASIDNDGLIIGRITLDTPASLYGDDELPDSAGSRSIDNSGLWVTSGASGFGYDGGNNGDNDVIRNSGSIWTMGLTTLVGDVESSGKIIVSSEYAERGSLTIAGDFTATGNSFGIQVDAGTLAPVDPMVTILGALYGSSSIDIIDLTGWDWQQDSRLELVSAASAELGQDAITYTDNVQGLVSYTLDYDDSNGSLWSLEASLSQQSTTQLGEVAAATQSGFVQLGTDILSRTDDLRDLFEGGSSAPMGYTAEPGTAATAAIAGLETEPGALRVWSKVSGAAGSGSGYDVALGGLQFGADAASSSATGQFALGLFGATSQSTLSFDDVAGSSSSSSNWAGGAYGTYLDDDGLFISGVGGVEHSAIDLDISGETASVDAVTFGGRVDLGYRLALDGITVEPSLGIRGSVSSIDGFEMSGLSASFDDPGLFAAEARLRVQRSFVGTAFDVTPFLTAAIGTQQGGGGLRIAGFDDVATDVSGLYGTVAAGIGFESVDRTWTGYARSEVTGTEDAWLATLRIGGAYRF